MIKKNIFVIRYRPTGKYVTFDDFAEPVFKNLESTITGGGIDGRFTDRKECKETISFAAKLLKLNRSDFEIVEVECSFRIIE